MCLCILACRLQTLVNYALKAERDLWGVLDGPWDGPDYANHRRAWSSQVCFHCGNSMQRRTTLGLQIISEKSKFFISSGCSSCHSTLTIGQEEEIYLLLGCY